MWPFSTVNTQVIDNGSTAAAAPAAIHDGESSSTNDNVCQLKCPMEQKTLVSCVDSIRAARAIELTTSGADENGGVEESTSTSADTATTTTPACLLPAVEAWTRCCAEANQTTSWRIRTADEWFWYHAIPRQRYHRVSTSLFLISLIITHTCIRNDDFRDGYSDSPSWCAYGLSTLVCLMNHVSWKMTDRICIYISVFRRCEPKVKEDDDMHIVAPNSSWARPLLKSFGNENSFRGVLPFFSSICCNDGINVIVTLTLVSLGNGLFIESIINGFLIDSMCFFFIPSSISRSYKAD